MQDDKDGHGKDTCKLDLCDTHEPVLCDIGDKDKDTTAAISVIDCGSNSPCGHVIMAIATFDPDPRPHDPDLRLFPRPRQRLSAAWASLESC